MESLKKIKEVNVIEEYIAIMNLLGELGYETEQLTVFQVAEIKRNIFQAIKGVEQ